MSVSSRTDHIQIARVIGIPIYLHFSWLIIFGLIVWTLSTGYFPAQYPDLPASSYWAKGLVASLLFFVSILLHELGHAVVALRQGLRTRSITLFIFGGVAQLEKDPRDGRAEFWMAAAGPVVSLTLAGLFYTFATLPLRGPFGRGGGAVPGPHQPHPRALQPGSGLPDGRRTAAARRPLGAPGQGARHPDRERSGDRLRIPPHLRRGLQPAPGRRARRRLVHPDRLVHQGRFGGQLPAGAPRRGAPGSRGPGRDGGDGRDGARERVGRRSGAGAASCEPATAAIP